MYYEKDYNEKTAEQWEEIAERLGADIPDDEQIWAVAREYDDEPHLGNIYLGILFENITAAVEEQYGESTARKITHFENGMDSHLYFDDGPITEADEFFELLDEDE